MLYCFSGFLCGAVLLGVALRNEALALVLGIAGCLAFLLILTSRLDELANLRGDLHERLARGRQERFAAKLTWEAIQRIELCNGLAAIRAILEQTAHKLGCDAVGLHCTRSGLDVPMAGPSRLGCHAHVRVSMPRGPGHAHADVGMAPDPVAHPGEIRPRGDVAAVSAPSAVFRITSGQDLHLTVALHPAPDSTLAADIAFRFLQRLALATAERIERLLADDAGDGDDAAGTPPAPGPRRGSGRPEAETTPVLAFTSSPSLSRTSTSWLRVALGWGARPVAHHTPFGDE